MSEKYPNHSKQIESSDERTLWSRRNFLRTVGVGAMTVATMRSWDIGAEMLREHNRVSIETIADDKAKATFPHKTTLFYPGLKNTWAESKRTAEALQPATRRFGQIARVGFSNQGFNEDEIFSESVRYCHQNDIDKVTLVGESMSGILITNMTPRFKNESIDVKAGFLLNSPSGANDVIDRASFDLMVMGCQAGMTLPECVRLIGELWERVENKNERTFLKILEQSLEQIGPQACSSKLVQEQAMYVNEGLKTPDLGDTQFAYLGNDSDIVVNFHSAVNAYRETLGKNFIETPYLTADAYHASASWEEFSGIYRRQIRIAARDLELIPEPKPTAIYF